LAREDPGAHDAALAQVARERTGVDPADADHALRLELVVETALGTPARGAARGLAHDVSRDPDPARLGVLVVDARVTDVRGGHDDDLAVVRGVREGLLVAGHAGVEDDLAEGLTEGAVGASGERPPVLEDEYCCAHPASFPVAGAIAATRSRACSGCRSRMPVSTGTSRSHVTTTRRSGSPIFPATPRSNRTASIRSSGMYRSVVP